MRRRNVKNAHERLVACPHVFVESPTDHFGKWHNLFGNNNPIHLEIGMGKGDFIIEHAKRNPNINYIGLEKYESVLIQAVDKAKDLNLSNLLLVCFDATDIDTIFDKEEIDKIYLNFSDPWPKFRHTKRRLTSSYFLNKYRVICKKPCLIEFKTDNRGLFEYSLMSLNENNFKFLDLTFNLHEREEDIIMTEYEKKFHSMGHNIYFVKTEYKG